MLCLHFNNTCTLHFVLTGNFEMLNELKMYFREPDSPDPKEKFTYIAYLTQVMH